jgi:hypothetical protein
VKLSKQIRKLIETRIQPEEIIAIVQEMSKLHHDGVETDWETSVIILARLHPGHPEKAHCISERMHCLVEMAKDARMHGWTFQGPEKGCLITNEAVFRAAALCPLHADPKHLWFDADEFFSLVLGETPSEGRA